MSNTGRYRKLEKRLRDLNSAVESMAYNVDCLSAANNGSLVGLSQSMACFVASTHAVRSSLCTPEIAREELKRPAEVIEHLDGRTISPNPVLPTPRHLVLRCQHSIVHRHADAYCLTTHTRSPRAIARAVSQEAGRKLLRWPRCASEHKHPRFACTKNMYLWSLQVLAYECVLVYTLD